MAFLPIYRAEAYQPRSTDPTESAVLVPPVGAPHSDAFRVASRQGVSVGGFSYKPYLVRVSGRRGRLDPLRKRMDVGSVTLEVGDIRITPGSGSNLTRWLTAFAGVLKGARMRVWESLDNGATWSIWWTGRVADVSTSGRIVWKITVEDLSADLKSLVFTRRPHSSVYGYADLLSQVPNSIPATTANERVNAIGLPVVPRPRATVGAAATEGLNYRLLAIRSDSTYLSTAINPDALNKASIQDLHLPPSAGGPPLMVRRARWTDNTVLRLRTDAGAEYAVEYLDMVALSTGTRVAIRALISQLPGGAALPANGTVLNIGLVENGAQVSELTPLYISPINPISLFKDLLDGDFGLLTTAGAQSNPVGYDATSVNALEAKQWVPHSYWITEGEDRSGFIEKNICEVCNVAWRLAPDGVVHLADLSIPTNGAALPLIEGADLLDPSDPPTWGETSDDTFPLVEVEFPVATFHPPAPGQPATSRGNIELTDDSHSFGFINQAEINYTIQKHSIKARGWLVGFDLSQPVASQTGDVLNRLQRTAEEGERLAGGLKYLFGGGPARVGARLRRLSKYDAIWPGMYVRYNFDEVPNKATHTRGGERVGLVLERSEEGLAMELLIHDCGSSANAVVPAISTPVLGALGNAVNTTITLNASGQPVEVEVAVADASVATAPVESSPLWRHVDTVVSAGTISVGALRLHADNRRVWLRARSVTSGGVTGLLPSNWIVTASVTLSAVASPSGLSVNGIGKGKAVVNWIAGDGTLAVDVYLFQGGADPGAWGSQHFVARVPAGSTSYEIRGLDGPTIQYRVALCHVGAYDSRGSVVSVGFTTTSDITTSPRPAGLDLALAGAGIPAY